MPGLSAQDPVKKSRWSAIRLAACWPSPSPCAATSPDWSAWCWFARFPCTTRNKPFPPRWRFMAGYSPRGGGSEARVVGRRWPSIAVLHRRGDGIRGCIGGGRRSAVPAIWLQISTYYCRLWNKISVTNSIWMPIICLAGALTFIGSTGEALTLHPGDRMMDMNTTGKGHTTEVVSEEPAEGIIIRVG